MGAPPTAKEIERQFEKLLAGECSREEADQWAGAWVYTDDSSRIDDARWKALQRLAGCDLRSGQNEPYLHTDEQIAEWLAEFRAESQSA